MKFFIICFAVLTIVCAGFWITDAPGSGMVYPTVGFALLGGGTAVYKKLTTGKWLSDSVAGK